MHNGRDNYRCPVHFLARTQQFQPKTCQSYPSFSSQHQTSLLISLNLCLRCLCLEYSWRTFALCRLSGFGWGVFEKIKQFRPRRFPMSLPMKYFREPLFYRAKSITFWSQPKATPSSLYCNSALSCFFDKLLRHNLHNRFNTKTLCSARCFLP